MEFELVWFANTHGRHAIWWMKPTWSHVKFGPRSWKMIHESSEKNTRKSVVFDHDLQFFNKFHCVSPIRLAYWLMWNHWVFFSISKLERWILGTDMGPVEGAPTIWIGVGLGHFPSPRGCSDDAWASSCFFFSRVRRNLLFPELAMRSA